MSTIAYRAGAIAGDTVITNGNTVVGLGNKIASDGSAIGGAVGLASFVADFTDWVRDGRPGDPPKPTDDTSAGFWVGRDELDRIHVVSYRGAHDVGAEFYAMGSGSDLAIGAMAMGATAAQAVEIAADCDVYTRAPVTALNFDPKFRFIGVNYDVEGLRSALARASQVVKHSPEEVVCAAVVLAVKGEGNEVRALSYRGFGDRDILEPLIGELLVGDEDDDPEDDDDDDPEAAPSAPLAN